MNTIAIIIFIAVVAFILYKGYKLISKKPYDGPYGGPTGGNGDTEDGDSSDGPTDVPTRNKGK